ncbi:MAG: thiamine biosynthesis protein ThiC [Erythrobacter sp.]
MEITLKRTAGIMAALLVLAAVTQAIYTVLYIGEVDINRKFLWSIEAVLFTALTAFAGAAMMQAKRYALGWAAIVFASALNVVQVGVGLVMFAPFREVAQAVPEAAPAAGAIVAFSFFVYNAAKALLGLAALVFGMAALTRAGARGAKALGGLTALVGVIAMTANALSMALGRDFSGELPLAGGSGVLATVLLALVLTGAAGEE